MRNMPSHSYLLAETRTLRFPESFVHMTKAVGRVCRRGLPA
jgi:hypothetical protein